MEGDVNATGPVGNLPPVMPGGPDPFAEGPDDPDGDDERTPGETGAGAGLAGWIPPADRTWRHPSEMGRVGGAGDAPFGRHGASQAALASAWPPARSAHHRAATLCVAAVAIMAVTVGSLLLVKTGEGPGTPQATLQTAVAGPVTASAGCCTVTAAVVRRTAASVVSLSRVTSPETSIGCGVVLAGAGLVATTADAVAGDRVVRVQTNGGRRLTATVVAVDLNSDVALLSVPALLDPARFADDTDVGPGFHSAVLVPDNGREHGVRWSTATVRSVGTAVPQGAGAGMAAIMVTGASAPAMAGQPLLDAQGEVIGLLDRSGSATGSGAPRAYLPAPLVVGVARQLAMTGKVEHGWLGLVGEDVSAGSPATSTPAQHTVPTTAAVVTGGTTTTGAEVLEVEPGGPAAQALRPGDIIVALDGRPVRTLAELRARLYVLPPGSRATIGVTRAGRSVTETVRLAATP